MGSDQLSISYCHSNEMVPILSPGIKMALTEKTNSTFPSTLPCQGASPSLCVFRLTIGEGVSEGKDKQGAGDHFDVSRFVLIQ